MKFLTNMPPGIFTSPPQEPEYRTFMFSQLQIEQAPRDKTKAKPKDESALQFGKVFTDHMLEIEWQESSGGWKAPQISPFHPLQIHPAAKVLHYACEAYEGMKAYRGVDGKIRLFRPQLNLERFLRSASRAMLPTFDTCEFLRCLRKLIQLEKDWIPSAEKSSLYIRPTFIGTDGSLGLNRTTEALLYVILSPVGPYFSTGFKPISLLADPKYCRAWVGGVGDVKLGSNYAPTVYVQKCAEAMGSQQALWLYGDEHFITEAGTMNIFVLIQCDNGEKELITPPLNGLILPGVTRQSILDLAREWGEFPVTERNMTMAEIMQLSKENRLLEMFGAGTACIICPVSEISYMNQKIHIPTVESENPICSRLLSNLNDIYYGKINHPWAYIIE